MQQLHQALRRDHHLKHGRCMQYGLTICITDDLFITAVQTVIPFVYAATSPGIETRPSFEARSLYAVQSYCITDDLFITAVKHSTRMQYGPIIYLAICLLQLSKQSFPLCMQQLHQALRRDHHLKHGGRMQYGLTICITDDLHITAVQAVLPSVYAAASPGVETRPSPKARRPYAVWSVPEGYRTVIGGSPQVLEIRVHENHGWR